jgi:hypothetical protein
MITTRQLESDIGATLFEGQKHEDLPRVFRKLATWVTEQSGLEGTFTVLGLNLEWLDVGFILTVTTEST